jgi:amidohydrolase
MADLRPLLEEARALQPRVVDLRRRIHAEPELGLRNDRTREKVLAALDGLGLEIERHTTTSGVVATLRGERSGSAVLLRADTDALPMREDADVPFRSTREGAMHACGHDAHVAMLVGAAQLLAARRSELAGDVVFMFQPGEEGFAGARAMLDEGLLARTPEIAGAFALHVAPLLEPGVVATRLCGALLASADVFSVEVRGEGGHASMPQDCRDPIPAACEIVLALQSFVTRSVPAADPVVLSVTQVHAGTTGNVIPETACLNGTLRSLSERSRRIASDGLTRVAENVARAHGLEASVSLSSGYPVTENDPDFARFAFEVARDLLGSGGALEFPAPIMGAEDFSYVLQRVPGAMFFIGVKPPGVAEPAPVHSNRMLLNEEGMASGVALHAAIALRFLQRRAR